MGKAKFSRLLDRCFESMIIGHNYTSKRKVDGNTYMGDLGLEVDVQSFSHIVICTCYLERPTEICILGRYGS